MSLLAVSARDVSFPSQEVFEQFVSREKAKRIAYGIFATLLIPCFATLATLAVALPPLFYAAALLGTGGGALFSLYSAFHNLFSYFGVKNLAPPSALYADVKCTSGPCHGTPLQDGPATHQKRLKMIEKAERNVTLSGCYCGGKAFQEILTALQAKLGGDAAFTALLITSNLFLTEENRTLIEALERDHPHCFQCVIHSEVAPLYTPAHGLTWTTNHTKATIIDEGAEWILGGSGVLDAWKETDGLQPVQLAGGAPFAFPASLFEGNGFRDIDFHFAQSEGRGIGTQLFIEIHRLADRLAHRDGRVVEHPEISPVLDLPPPKPAGDLETTLYFHGPEYPLSYLQDMIEAVKGAKKSIKICHLYFHPPQELFEALLEAAERDVKIEIVTNRDGEKAPLSHSGFTDLSEWYWRQLLASDGGGNVSVYTYGIDHTTLHKKVVLVDRETAFIGSSNIGWKSLEGNDYEVNMRVVSKSFCKQTAKILRETRKTAIEVEDDAPPSLLTRIHACWQSCTSFIL